MSKNTPVMLQQLLSIQKTSTRNLNFHFLKTANWQLRKITVYKIKTSVSKFERPNKYKAVYSLSSTHIWLSGSRRRPVGHAQDTLGECGPILGAGRQRWEQWPLTAAQWFTPSGCRYGWYTWITIGFCSCGGGLKLVFCFCDVITMFRWFCFCFRDVFTMGCCWARI